MKRLQVVFTDEAWSSVEAITSQANENFDLGSISYSDVVNELVLNAKIDVKTLQAKHTDVRRSLKSFAAQKDIDIDLIIKPLSDLKGKPQKKRTSNSQEVNNV